MLALAASMPISAHDFERNGIYYNYNPDGVSVSVTFKGNRAVSYDNEYTGAVVIPESVSLSGTNYVVTAIGDDAFFNCQNVTSVNIPNTVTSIGNSAFSNCKKLTTINITDNITYIGGYAFYVTPFYNELPDGLVYLGRVLYCYKGEMPANSSIDINEGTVCISPYAFSFCKGLLSVSIPNTVEIIGKEAFYGCSSLTNLLIPESVISVEWCALGGGCNSLESIVVDDGNPVYDSRDNCNAIIEKNSNTLVNGCKNTIIPNNITVIGECAFSQISSLSSIVIPESVTSIGSLAFSDCSGLSFIDIPNSVTTIGGSAFNGCTGLTSLTIPNSVTSIGKFAFEGCSNLNTISIGNSVSTIGDGAFRDCVGLKSFQSSNITPPAVVFNYPPYDNYNFEAYNTFYNVPTTTCVLYVPANSVEMYRNAEGWKEFSNITEIIYSGINKPNTNEVTVISENGVIRIEGADGAAVEVFNASGVCIYSGTATEIPVPQRGLYVVKVAGRATKLAL